MQKEKNREEIKNEFKWDLTTIYKSDKECLKDLEALKKLLPKYETFRGKINKSSNDLLIFLKFDEDFERKLLKVYYYIHLHFDEDTTNTNYQEMKGKCELFLQQVAETTSFITEERMKTPYSTIKKYIKENKDLNIYSHHLENFYRMQKHALTETEEKVVSTFSNVLSASEDIFSALSNADLNFGTILDENKNEVELNSSNYSLFIRSKDRTVRKDAFLKLHKGFGMFKNTLSKVFQNQVEYLVQSAKIHKFNSSLEASLAQDNIEVKVYDNLIDTVHNNLSIAYKYFALKKEMLNLDELHNYDIYTELIEDYDKKYPFVEAKELVLKALEPLGEDYQKHLLRAFDEKWIDIYHNKGKRSGAYSSGFYDVNPFLLLNYENTLNDVSTLAHELGHSMHSLYSWENNEYINSSYKIFVAEVASTVNELLLFKYLLKTTNDKREKLTILNNLMELFKGTIIRQTMFAEFEKNIHASFEKGNILTHEYLEKEYFKLNKLYFGDNVTLDEEIKYEWMRIPHFYYNFYVYKYVIGLSCAAYIVNNILDGKKGAKEAYLKFLSSGGSMYPADELKIAGIDITSKEVIESALKIFDETIEEFKSLIKES